MADGQKNRRQTGALRGASKVKEIQVKEI